MSRKEQGDCLIRDGKDRGRSAQGGSPPRSHLQGPWNEKERVGRMGEVFSNGKIGKVEVGNTGMKGGCNFEAREPIRDALTPSVRQAAIS